MAGIAASHPVASNGKNLLVKNNVSNTLKIGNTKDRVFLEFYCMQLIVNYLFVKEIIKDYKGVAPTK